MNGSSSRGTQFAEQVDFSENGLVYDPDQDHEEKREVRRGYRDLQKSTEGARLASLRIMYCWYLTWNRPSFGLKCGGADARCSTTEHSLRFRSGRLDIFHGARDSYGRFPVKNPQEATLDSAQLLHFSNLGANQARALRSGPSAFDVDDFVSKLIVYMGGGRQLARDEAGGPASDVDMEDDDAPLDWEKIGRRALAKSRRVPVMDFM
jgi:hypothetical protein